MIITCEKCQAKFKVAPEQIKEGGSKVRCSDCQHIFTVFRPREDRGAPEKKAEETAKDRRERRKKLYSELEDEPGKATFDDSLDEIFDDGELPEFTDTDDLPPPLEDSRADHLGLDSDPAGKRSAAGARGSIRAAEAGSGKNSWLLPAIFIVVMAILGGLYYMSKRPAPTALSTAEPPLEQNQNQPDAAAGAAPSASAPDDPAGTLNITFSPNNQNHYFRENAREGTLLIITGLVRNSYQTPRSFIHLRGRLISADGSTLADRYAYAGNILSEEDLATLPIGEIFSRLSIKGGQNGRNMNVAPGREAPFMLVFDKLPDGMTEYRIDPMGSSPAE